MFISMLSVVTSVKDYVEIVHKLIESDSTNQLQTYYDLGAIITYVVLTAKQFFVDLITLNWLQNLWSLPTLIPSIASSMVSEISVLDGYFHNAFTFLETPVSYGDQNVTLYCLEKFIIGLINSIFLCLPTSIAHLICLRRFVMQGLEAGYLAGLGTVAGNFLWISSVIFGLRFLIIPWLSLDILRYLLGFILLVKYMWDSYTERRGVLEDLSKWKIFLLNFLLAFTEQTSIYPFVSNLTIGSDSTLLESFPADSFLEFVSIHGCYLSGILLGSLSLLHLTCWFWENPAYSLYIWMISSLKVTTGIYHKSLNFFFLYMTMICAVSSMTYFGLDYTLANPLGLVQEDRLIDRSQKLLEISFFNTKASDRNTRRNRGRHGRRERWKRRIRKYRTFDASPYDQGIYDLFTIEDLNYGFDRFWLRRKMKNHRVRFRFFPGPWMRSFKKQLARPRIESFMGPRVEFFRILFEQIHHPQFHDFKEPRSTSSGILNSILRRNKKSSDTDVVGKTTGTPIDSTTILPTLVQTHSKKITSIYSDKVEKHQTQGLIKEFSALRKFVRKVNTRVKASTIALQLKTSNSSQNGFLNDSVKPIYSKRWKKIFSKISHSLSNPHLRQQENLFRRLYNQILMTDSKPNELLLNNASKTINKSGGFSVWNIFSNKSKKEDFKQRLSKKDRQILRYKTFLKQNSILSNEKDASSLSPLEPFSFNNETNRDSIIQKQNMEQYEKDIYKSMTLLHPIKFYLQKEQAFRRKLKFYGANVFRNFGIENNSAYFRIMMKRFFYYYKPTLRWERTMRASSLRRVRRKKARIPRKMNLNKQIQGLSRFDVNDEESLLNPNTSTELNLKTISPNFSSIQKPTHFYSLVNKRASRYRYEIYKDLLQHWYYSPFNRLLLKFDVDSFIRRQPSSYFLTKKEENLLHMRRLLLSDYYETLRWYTYMQHYGSMKARIGGTKSFASRIYNQQFMGTLRKVRHLFAITPSSTENTVLKFDQPLYNEFANNQTQSILNESIIHEELLADDLLYTNDAISGNDLKNQSALVIREYLANAKPIREQFIKKLLSEKNYWELTKFLFKGQKIRGTNAVTNERSFLAQEKQILYTPEEKQKFYEDQQQKLKQFFDQKIASMFNNDDFSKVSSTSIEENIWLALIKKCENQLYNQESLKLYLARHIEKHDRQKQRQEKVINSRLQRMKNWLILQNQSAKDKNKERISPNSVDNGISSTAGLTTALQKAIKEAVFFQKGWNPVKTNIRNNRPQINWAIIDSTSNQKSFQNGQKSILISGNFRKSTNLKNHLKIRLKLHQMQVGKIENDLRKSIISVRTHETSDISSKKPFNQSSTAIQNISYLLKTTLIPFKKIYKRSLSPMISKSINAINRMFQQNAEDDLVTWRKREIVLNKRKKSRKTFKKLKNKNVRKSETWNTRDLLRYNIQKNSEDLLREKRDAQNSRAMSWIDSENKRHKNSWKEWRKQFNAASSEDSTRRTRSPETSLIRGVMDNIKAKTNPTNLIRLFNQIRAKKFKRKRSRLRRHRRVKIRGVVKKRTLGQKLKRQFKLLKKYRATREDSLVSDKSENLRKKLEIFEKITKRTYKPESVFQTKEIKQRRTRQRKNRFWKKHRRPKYGQNKRKQRKRRRHAVGKIRSLNKQLKRIKSNIKLKKWWWENFLPNFQANADAIWQIENDVQIQQQLSKLSVSEILERDSYTMTNMAENTLQIGDKDYKPLAIPEALRIRENLIQNKLLNFDDSYDSTQNATLQSDSKTDSNNKNKQIIDTLEKLNQKTSKMISNDNTQKSDLDFIGQISQNSLISNDKNQNLLKSFDSFDETTLNNRTVSAINPIPFYAGWDESLRKFVVTNRLLCNKQATYAMNLTGEIGVPAASDAKSEKNDLGNSEYVKQRAFSKLFKTLNSSNLEFSQAPLQGMNAATTVYWQALFTTYDPDQFFALGMDGFSPIGWRKFHFRHSKQTIKPILVKTKTIGSSQLIQKTNKHDSNLSDNTLSYNIQMKIFENKFKNKSEILFKNKTSQKNAYRRIQKRNKRVRKHPRPPVWFPSGPLANEVLPVHYIYVFYKRARLPRDRYVRRRLRRNKDGAPLSIRTSMTKLTDMTLRRRSKPKRKYHRKRSKSALLRVSTFGKNAPLSAKTGNLLLKRRAFRGFPHEDDRSRPIPESQNIQKTKKSKKPKTRRKKLTTKPPESARIRQLRRRVPRLVLYPVWRHRPRIGGFVWPGDYLRLKNSDAPKLKPTTPKSRPKAQILKTKQDEPKRLRKKRRIRKKKQRKIQEWQVQPKKYFLQKHNMRVLKKRLQKSQNTNKIHQRIKELTYLFKNK
uniref:Hypothetical chloroplast protein RF1 n=1 Tax=Bracteacoccus aerius TaxID=50041 RepID=A0A140HAR2_9CHLO|nr:hypothetical chloroplast protein RF1 [Bracteacoccus aerius]AMO01261.1 hypothetical chloroplast protein RF1 [Bracteacoccus aerius]